MFQSFTTITSPIPRQEYVSLEMARDDSDQQPLTNDRQPPTRSSTFGDDDEGSGDPGGASADVQFCVDMYDAVAVAAFGGVKANLEKIGGKSENMVVHPIFLFICCIPLFSIQLSTMFFLRLDPTAALKGTFINSEPGQDVDIRSAFSGNMLLHSKLWMMIVVQLMLFKEILGSLQLLVFLLNPQTWADINRMDHENMKLKYPLNLLFAPFMIAPWPILAIILKLAIGYMVCVDSVSIILSCDTVKDAIFDSLAITFVKDLDEIFWKVCSAAFHLEDFEGFEFVLAPREFRRRVRKKAYIKTPKFLRILKRGHGARKVEVICAYSLLFVIYFRQLNVIVYALHTDVLPVARDMCTFWRYQTGQAEHLKRIQVVVRWILANLLVMNPETEITEKCDPEITGKDGSLGYCTPKYERMRNSDMAEMWSLYPDVLLGGTAVIIVVFIIPQVGYTFNKQLRACIRAEVDVTGDSAQEQSSATTAENMQKEIKAMREELEELKKNK